MTKRTSEAPTLDVGSARAEIEQLVERFKDDPEVLEKILVVARNAVAELDSRADEARGDAIICSFVQEINDLLYKAGINDFLSNAFSNASDKIDLYFQSPPLFNLSPVMIDQAKFDALFGPNTEGRLISLRKPRSAESYEREDAEIFHLGPSVIVLVSATDRQCVRLRMDQSENDVFKPCKFEKGEVCT